ncbi:hypothetical protein THASP1DRAFT_22943 [Thamnocephalis sphaerospora]|uniref:Protein kinase domain-containing protein n=1 Tax=Thamnocephalis sphaerospora TaxID=78915 RepID=A0A4P9XSQ4_9FUNG|nr:hypothetical protein THASP1DRAFT_22943 [Thamnocephalis sphaerospora]|eukprot:RKP09175.1 hypothetical protein THASP1DRAFT_22943 [Thamnocephalis sphaerospora]
MKCIVATMLLATMASTLGYDSDAHASPARRIARAQRPITASDWSHIPELDIKKVNYKGNEGTVVCTSSDFLGRRIKHTAKTHLVWLSYLLAHSQSWSRFRISAIGCLENVNFYYESISPESIRIRNGMAKVPYVILTDLHRITGIYKKKFGAIHTDIPQEDEPESYENESGYRPPEDHLAPENDGHTGMTSVKKRISWMLGATICDVSTGVPPYGFEKYLTGIRPWKSGELKRVMLELQKSKETCLPVKISSQHLNALTEKLTTCIANDRPTIRKLDLELVQRLADDSDIKIAGNHIIQGTMMVTGAALNAINPFFRHQQSSVKITESQ